MALVSVLFTLTDDTVPFAVLDDVVVRVFSEDGATFITQGTTDEDGELVVDLEASTTYWVRFFKVGYSADSQLLIDVVDSDSIFDVALTNLTELSPSTVPYLCRAAGYVRGADFAPRAGLRITFSLTDRPQIVAGEVMVVQDVIVVSDVRGWVEVELARNAVYDCVVDGLDDSVHRVVVPDRTSVRLAELLWPYVAVLAYMEDEVALTSVELAVAETLQVAAVVRLSSGVETPYELDDGTEFHASDKVSVSVADTAVATAVLSGDILSITGVGVGSTVVSATVATYAEMRRRPEPTRFFTELTVTVTE